MRSACRLKTACRCDSFGPRPSRDARAQARSLGSKVARKQGRSETTSPSGSRRTGTFIPTPSLMSQGPSFDAVAGEPGADAAPSVDAPRTRAFGREPGREAGTTDGVADLRPRRPTHPRDMLDDDPPGPWAPQQRAWSRDRATENTASILDRALDLRCVEAIRGPRHRAVSAPVSLRTLCEARRLAATCGSSSEFRAAACTVDRAPSALSNPRVDRRRNAPVRPVLESRLVRCGAEGSSRNPP